MSRQLLVLFMFALLLVAQADAQAPGARGGGARGAGAPAAAARGVGGAAQNPNIASPAEFLIRSRWSSWREPPYRDGPHQTRAAAL
jgi:hypothetical protein